jgi:sec-independent protein translocase protein TatA
MGPIGIPELLVILFIMILIFGAARLPAIGKGLGEAINNFKDSFKEGKKEADKKNLGNSAREKEN